MTVATAMPVVKANATAMAMNIFVMLTPGKSLSMRHHAEYSDIFLKGQ
jgi:hypothetical protein